MSKNNFKIFILAGFLISYIFGYFTDKFLQIFSSENILQIREDSPEYKFINPLLIVSNQESKYKELNPLKKVMKNYISKMNNGEDGVYDVSVYFRLMNTGRWTGVNEDNLYAPSSMLKLITLMSVLKKAESRESILKELRYYDNKTESGQYYKPVFLVNGFYDILTLLKQMIIESDNIAMDLINKENIEGIVSIHEDLKLQSPIGAPNDFMSPRIYSRFFRTLYNATYLSRNHSEQALSLMSHINFKKGLVSGLPSGMLISHKFGEQTYTEDGVLKYRELHDCGIVYLKNKEPYFICVMTKGKDFAQLEKVIADISKLVFNYINKYE